MADVIATDATADPCCATQQQATCCAPGEKADCCGHGDGCGCGEAAYASQEGDARDQAQAASAIVRARKSAGRSA